MHISCMTWFFPRPSSITVIVYIVYFSLSLKPSRSLQYSNDFTTLVSPLFLVCPCVFSHPFTTGTGHRWVFILSYVVDWFFSFCLIQFLYFFWWSKRIWLPKLGWIWIFGREIRFISKECGDGQCYKKRGGSYFWGAGRGLSWVRWGFPPWRDDWYRYLLGSKFKACFGERRKMYILYTVGRTYF